MATTQEIIDEAMTHHAKHYWSLIQWCKSHRKSDYQFAEMIGEGSRVGLAIWKKYENWYSPEKEANP